MVIGLLRPSIRIALDANSPPLDIDARVFIMTRNPTVVYEPSNSGCRLLSLTSQTLMLLAWSFLYTVISSLRYFSWFYCELKGPVGMAGTARIQNYTACLIGHRIHSRLAKLARAAGPASFRAPTWTMRRIYGLQTFGFGATWKLVVMVAHTADEDTAGGDELEVKYYVSFGPAWSPFLISITAADACASRSLNDDRTLASHVLLPLNRWLPPPRFHPQYLSIAYPAAFRTT